MKGIKIDNIYYNVRVVFKSATRSFELTEGNNSGTSISGRSIRDILGTSYSYSMTVEPNPADPEAYDDFYYKITEPVDYHTVELPFGQETLSFQAQIISGSDTYRGRVGGKERWGGLSLQFVPMEPQRT